MKDTYLKVSAEERLRMERIVLDGDSDDALKLVKDWLDRVSSAERTGMQSHLDNRPGG